MAQETAPRHSPSPFVATTMIAAVRALYEAYPYPRYPLLATPRWQDGYLTHSSFAATLVADLASPQEAGTALPRVKAPPPAAPVTILIGGGGEILPYVIRKWEPNSHQVISVDLSAHSLRRARWRCLLHQRRTSFARADLDSYLQTQPAHTFSHIDAYGVLHHMPNPSATLASMSSRLAPGGTLRVMVYNAEARRWIRHLQKLFAVLEVDRFCPKEVRAAKNLLHLASAESPALAERLQQLGPGTLSNSARFADTFLHPRETRLGIAAWLSAIDRAGLRVVGLLDRYAELDDLPNPLWQMPSSQELVERAQDGRFEHNLELFITRGGAQDSTCSPLTRGGRFRQLPHLFKAPPTSWFSYDETKDLSFSLRLRLWQAHLAWVMERDRRRISGVLSSLPTQALQRLTRIGAILPGQIADQGRSAALARAMVETCTAAPERALAVPLQGPKLHEALGAMLTAKGRTSPHYLQQAMGRLVAAQC